MTSRTTFTTFDRSLQLTALQQRADRYRDLDAISKGTPRIAQGACLSYVAASFAEGAISQQMTRFNRLLARPSESSLKVEAGITLAKLVTVLEQWGLHLPVLPGHPCITVGGCIAADAHGKNPLRDGTFCDWVEAMTLFHSDRGFQSITRRTDRELFELTCGGLGLTGVIVDATLRLASAGGAMLRVTKSPCTSLGHAAEMLDGSGRHEFAYSWHDGSGRGSSFGRGLLIVGEWVEDEADDKARSSSAASGKRRGPFPFSLWTSGMTRLVNATYLRLAGLNATSIESRSNAFFPLAGAPTYFQAFGPRGVIEVQLLLSTDAFPAFERELRCLVGRVDPVLVLMSLKRFRGRQLGCTLSGNGILIALNLPRNESARTNKFLNELDALALDVEAQPNVMKDGRVSEWTARRSLPNYPSFAGRLARYDSGRLYRSALSQRLGL